MEPERPVQTVFLGDTEVSYSLSLSQPSPISGALGDCVMSFDFGPSEEVQKKSGSYRSSKVDTRTVWPIYCVRGNGDVIVAYTDLSERSVVKEKFSCHDYVSISLFAQCIFPQSVSQQTAKICINNYILQQK